MHVQLFVHSGLKYAFLLVILYVHRGEGEESEGGGTAESGLGGGGGDLEVLQRGCTEQGEGFPQKGF